MSYKLANLSGAPLEIHSGSQVLQVPAGWLGDVTAVGAVSVYGTQRVVSTNYTPEAQLGTMELSASVNAPYTLWLSHGPGVIPSNTSLDWHIRLNGTNIHPLGYSANIFLGPTVKTVHLQVTTDGNVGNTTSEYHTTYYGTNTSYVTNNTPSVLLGTYTADTTLRAVQVSSDGVTVEDFALSVEAFSLGFIFSLTVAVYKWVTRIFRTLPGNAGEF